MLGTFVVLYLFLGGCGAAALFVTAVWSLLFHRTETRTFQQSRAFWDLAGKLYLASFGLLALSAFCLLLDLGSPHRFFLLFLRPTASLLSAGSFVLLAALLASGCLAAVHALGWPAPSWARKGLEALCAVLATVLMVYTGWKPCPFGAMGRSRLCSRSRRSLREWLQCFSRRLLCAIGHFCPAG